MNSVPSRSRAPHLPRIRGQRGFTLFELTIAVLVATFILLAVSHRMVGTYEQSAAQTEASAIYDIASAAQTYYVQNSQWPNQATGCANAITALTTAGLLGGISTKNIWGNTITTACATPNVLTITSQADTAQWAQMMASQEAATTVSGSTTTTNVPIPGEQPSLTNLLHRYYDPANPTLNQMETAIDMNNNNINNGGVITSKATGSAFLATKGGFESQLANGNAFTWGNSSHLTTDQGGSLQLGGDGANPGVGNPYIQFYDGSAGPSGSSWNAELINNQPGELTANVNVLQASNDALVNRNLQINGSAVATDVVLSGKKRSLAQAIQDSVIVDAADTAANRTIPKPVCPNGLTPAVFTAVSQAAEGSTSYPLAQIVTYATDNGPSWTANMAIATPDITTGDYTPAPGYGRILVLTKCQ